ncbi:MAG TPA: aminotransferase class I/II-fold pyridoxal phosphate-dependent enzyme [Candidatus Binatus sp.]|jgi:aspartate/methionine/tyrosine aminotransferase|nr:aminotransferase class I/II-fold pyridoxal phosphate-dependent enzyme [Candidatus Binatus sp.]
MKIQPFELERWQSIWENKVELNISESGVHPLSTAELVPDAATLQKILDVPQYYPQTNGSEELRSRIAELYPGAKAENVLVTCGGSEANFVATWALLEPGDEIVFMMPNYMQIAGLAGAFGATVKPLWLREELQWGIDRDELPRLIGPRTRLVAICNPNNPTGSVLKKEEREAIVAAAEKVGAWILADEVYRGAEFDGSMTTSFWGGYDRILCTAGLSKAFSLPGLRTGWVVGAPKMIERFWGYHDYTSIGPSMLTDRLASVALEPKRRAWILNRTRETLLRNYLPLRAWLDSHADSFTHVPPKAGAIAWAGLRSGQNSLQMAEQLREKKSVLLVAGEQLGMESFVRFGFGGDREHLQKALVRVDEWLQENRVAAHAR